MQKGAYNCRLITEHGLNIYTKKMIVFKGWNPSRSNIVTHNKVIEQVNSFHYSGSLIFYENEVDIDNKLNNHLTITGLINSMFRPHKTWNKKE